MPFADTQATKPISELNPYEPPAEKENSSRTLSVEDFRSAILQGLAVLVILFSIDFFLDETPDLYYNFGAPIAVFGCTLIYRSFTSGRRDSANSGQSDEHLETDDAP
ncbi:hypothetical protein Poly51_49050 [Rubripirellula tenax]|uniref:Uncharacterized protein n=1 Tax=Rubripirellula tenax TaxID=2528015 RepID=A0A5C6EMY1_9BACT|nr:hypothetical protein [Rubripirellula tenax]TWU49001.1 hypothetical protein Poly51_49050 [Rubripirellula tenax]